MPVESVTAAVVEAATDRFTLGLVIGFLGGGAVPTYYFQERMRGFGRAVADRIPYRPPPGKSEEEALQEAQQAAEGDPDDAENR